MNEYAFWKVPRGKTRRNKAAPNDLLSKIGKMASVQADGGIMYPMNSFMMKQPHDIVSALVIIEDKDGNVLNERDTQILVSNAIAHEIRANRNKKPVVADDLLLAIDELAKKYFALSPTQYITITSLSTESLPAKSIRINGCVISSLKKRGPKYPIPSFPTQKELRQQIDERLENTDDYLTIKIKSHGRSVHEGAENAIEALDLLRGLWTLFGTRGSTSMTFPKPLSKSIGVLQRGPVHTLHLPSGQLADDVVWIQEDYSKDTSLYDPNESEWEKIERERKWAVRQLKKLKYGKELTDLILRYINAIDQSNLEVSFLHMWSILEAVTNKIGAGYDDVIKRASWVSIDPTESKNFLSYLRLRRNKLVHAANSDDNKTLVAYMIKNIVEPHLVYLLKRAFKVNSIEEYGDFLDKPTNVDALKKRREALELNSIKEIEELDMAIMFQES